MADIVNRDFAMAFADLIGVCKTIHLCIIRDAVPFLSYGINSAAAIDFAAKINAFQNLPTDSEFASDVVIASQNKYAIVNDLKIMLRSFNVRAKLAFGESSGEYGKFNLKDLSHANDNDLLVFSQKVQRASLVYHTELATAGVTEEMITVLGAKITQFESARDAQDDAIMDRDNASNNRVKKANELYSLLTRYCDVGKTIWYETNEALYNDYVMYSPSSGTISAPEGLSFNNSTQRFTWNSVANASFYQLEESINGLDFTEVYAGNETFVIYEPSVNGNSWFRIRSRSSSGYSNFSNVLNVIYYQILPIPLNLQFTLGGNNNVNLHFDAVPTAELYSIYKSSVGLGEPAGTFAFIGEYSVNTYSGQVHVSQRHYFRVSAKNSYQTSDMSNMVFVDII